MQKMLKTTFFVYLIFITSSLSTRAYVEALDDASGCDTLLDKYRRLVAEAFLNFDDACDLYDALAVPDATNTQENVYETSSHPKGGMFRGAFIFYRYITAQFNDIELVYAMKKMLRDKCHETTQTIYDVGDKREGVVIGKKQRFHAWGGKRSGLSSPITLTRQHLSLQPQPQQQQPSYLSWND